MKPLSHLIPQLGLFACTPSLFALELGSPFQEHMVLQRDRPINVWGTAEPGEKISVTLANQPATQVVTGKDGKWSLKLPKSAAGGPFKFEAKSPKKTITFKDVLVGEVWICSGQSNMHMGWKGIPAIKALAADIKQVRSLEVTKRVAMTPQERALGKWQTSGPNSAVAMSFAAHLERDTKVPIGILHLSWGSSSIEGWMPKQLSAQLPHFKKQLADFEANDKKRVLEIMAKGGKHERKEDIFIRTRPNILYNAMMHPHLKFSCRGMVWYQGEANSKTVANMLLYQRSQHLWLAELRKLTKNPDFHFLSVMLPGFGKVLSSGPNNNANHPDAHTWGWMRDSQLALLKQPNTGVATTIDLGEAKNIHPKDKEPIGKRLALLAQRDVLKLPVTAEGPVVKAVKANGNKLVLSYDNADKLTTTDGKPPRHFWIKAKDGEWNTATATIKDDTIELTNPNVKSPLYVRYAFAAIPDVNLTNSTKLPARPYRNDTLPPASK